jgi:lipid-binding SYLF domain-containing protein
MKTCGIILSLWILLMGLAGCGPSRQLTIADQQNAIDTMASRTLDDLYLNVPSARQKVENAAGYAVFSNASAAVVFVSGGGGFGVAVNNADRSHTYMKMSIVGVGLGLGAKDYRQILIFNDRFALNTFITSGWDLGGQAGAAAKASQTGGSLAGEGTIKDDVSVYTLTKSGLIAEVTLTGYKYWVDPDLNIIQIRPRQSGSMQYEPMSF